MSAAAARDVGAESRDMYSVLRSHETFGVAGGAPPAWWPWPWCRPKSAVLAVGSSSSA